MIQIIGTKKCKETAKAIRACKERNIPYQFVDLSQRVLSDGEWRSIFQKYKAEDLIDTDSSYYKKEGYSWRDYDAEQELIEHPELLKTPVLRSKNRVHQGFDITILSSWSDQ